VEGSSLRYPKLALITKFIRLIGSDQKLKALSCCEPSHKKKHKSPPIEKTQAMDPYNNNNSNPYMLPSNNTNTNPPVEYASNIGVSSYSEPFPAPPSDFQSQQDLDNFYGNESVDPYGNNYMAPQQQQQPLNQTSYTSGGGISSSSEQTAGIKGKVGALAGKLTLAEDSIIMGANGISDHKHPKLFVRLTIILAMIMSLCLLIFLFTTPYGYPWFIHVWWVGLVTIGVVYISGTKKPLLGTQGFTYHFVISVLTTFMLILTNEHAAGKRGYPWSIYPVAVLALCLCIHATFALFPAYRTHFHIHVLCWFFGNGIIFLAWCYSHPGKVFVFPWFAFPLVIWTGLLIAHWFLWLFLQRRSARSAEAPVRNMSTAAPTESMYSYGENQVV